MSLATQHETELSTWDKSTLQSRIRELKIPALKADELFNQIMRKSVSHINANQEKMVFGLFTMNQDIFELSNFTKYTWQTMAYSAIKFEWVSRLEAITCGKDMVDIASADIATMLAVATREHIKHELFRSMQDPSYAKKCDLIPKNPLELEKVMRIFKEPKAVAPVQPSSATTINATNVQINASEKKPEALPEHSPTNIEMFSEIERVASLATVKKTLADEKSEDAEILEE